MSINEELLRILVCPETKRPVGLAEAALVSAVNKQISDGQLTNRGGQVVKEPVEALLIRDDGVVAYPVREGIPIMLIDEAFVLKPAGQADDLNST